MDSYNQKQRSFMRIAVLEKQGDMLFGGVKARAFMENPMVKCISMFGKARIALTAIAISAATSAFGGFGDFLNAVDKAAGSVNNTVQSVREEKRSRRESKKAKARQAQAAEQEKAAQPVEETPAAQPVEEAPVAQPVEETPAAQPVEEAPVAQPVQPVEETPAAQPEQSAGGSRRARSAAAGRSKSGAYEAEMAARREKDQVCKVQEECLNLFQGGMYSSSPYSYDGVCKKQADIKAYFASDVSLEKAKEYKAALEKEIEADNAFISGLESSTDDAALCQALNDGKFSRENVQKIAKRLADTSKDAAILVSLYCGDKENLIEYQYKGNVAARLAELSDGISDTNVVVKLLSSDHVKNADHRAKLLAVLPEADAVAFVKDQLKRHSVDKWNEGNLGAFYDAVALMKASKDPNACVESVSLVLGKIAEYKDQCKRSLFLSWGDGDEEAVANIMKAFPKLDDKKLEEVLCADETSWTYFVDSASEDVAYGVLSSGKAKSGELEVALAKKLPSEKIDQKVYDGTRSDAAKKALVEKMSPSMKKSVAKAAEKAYKDVCAKAKAAAKETFELDGFYLGMSFNDAKVVLARHFPDLEQRDEIDGKGDDADHVVYLPGQKSPFCFASCSDKKVYQFNFGKKLLKKWYDFDVQTYMEWAAAYGRKTKSDMRFELLEKDTTVWEDDMSDSYKVWFHQEAYRYKNSKKEYRVTYFGEEKEFTIEGGIGGDLIKGRAAPDFRYFRGDPGSLRVQVMKD